MTIGNEHIFSFSGVKGEMIMGEPAGNGIEVILLDQRWS